jgi:CRP-like cAMP-binding protein
MVTPAAAERFLAAPWLVDVEPALRQAVLQVLAEGRAEAGTNLLEQGRPNDHITFLIDGAVTVERAFADGRVETIVDLHAPTVFGETSFFRRSPSIVTVRAAKPVWFLTLDRPAHDRLRRENLRASEALALAAVRVLADRFDLLDRRLSDYIAQHPDSPSRANEWSRFRARLFEEQNL